MSAGMAEIATLFPTKIYRAEIADEALVQEIDGTCRSAAADDDAGIAWCEKNAYPGYTSYASLDDLPWRFPIFKKLVKQIDKHVAAFAKELEFELGGKKLALDSIWINVLEPGGMHSSHIHPHSVISGTFYVAIPDGASSLKYEDPRLGFMMASPPRKKKAKDENRQFIYMAPQPGTLLLWEGWLRHEVPMNQADEERISVSFNYAWG